MNALKKSWCKFQASSRWIVGRANAAWLPAALAATLLLLPNGELRRAFAGEEPSAQSADYLLDSEDVVRLRIFEWRPALDQVYEWKALNAEYTVGPNGYVSLPLLGNIRARGKSTTQLGEAVGALMRQQIGVGDLPQISVEIDKYRPFYINGRIRKAGAYPYHPRLTVMQAVSIAGGIVADESAGARFGREYIAEQGNLTTLGLKRASLLARIARLEAELNDQEQIDTKYFEQISPTLAAVYRREGAMLSAKKSELEMRIGAAKARKAVLNAELQSMETRLRNHDASLGLAKQELQDVELLVSKRLTTQTRRTGAQRNVYQLEGDRQLLLSERLRIREAIDKVDIDLAALQASRQSETMQALLVAQSELFEIEGKIDTAQALVEETTTMSRLVSDDGDESETRPVYTIIRGSDTNVVRMVVSDTAVLQPGDTLMVEFPRAAGQRTRRLNAASRVPKDSGGLSPSDRFLTTPRLAVEDRPTIQQRRLPQ